jgi:ABC-type dipeptide/oligopeptide/nickel transport system permease component
MSHYMLRRLAQLIPVWLGITLLAFGLGQLTPGDPARLIAAQLADGPPTAAQIEQSEISGCRSKPEGRCWRS